MRLQFVSWALFAPLAFAQSGVSTFAGNAQHTAIYQPAAQNLNAIHWSTKIDLNNSGAFAHYGAPSITPANTVLVPVKTASNGFEVKAFNGASGASMYTLATDYILPSYDWIPTYNPALVSTTSGTRLYYAGAGGTIYYITNPDSATPGTPVQQAFYGLANYKANASNFNSTVFINTPITGDTNGNVFFGFRVQGTAPAPLNTTQSGFARIDPNGNATYVLAGTAAGDTNIAHDSHNSAPALSNDQSTIYVVAKSAGTDYYGYLLGLDATTLGSKYKVLLKDPRNGNDAGILDDSTASPTVAPDNDVYMGIFGNPDNGSRGFLLHFSSDLTVEKTPGAFGWDYTAGIVPASMVPSYIGSSSYLIFSKYNNYANGGGDNDGDGINKIALLDPNATQIDPHPAANGLVEMREVLTVIGVTPDSENYSSTFPYAVREWCINTAAINPATNSIFTPSEDGHIYRWNLTTNSLSQVLTLGSGVGEPYVPTVIGPDGTVYTLNGGSLFALGSLNGVGVAVASSVPDIRTVVTGQSVTFTATITNTGSSGAVPTGTVTFEDLTYQDLTPVTTTLAANVPLNSSGKATVTTSTLTAGNHFLGNHFITATYTGDSNFSSGSSTLIQKVHASASATQLTSSPNPSNWGQAVTFTATVTPSPSGSGTPSGMVTFLQGAIVLAQVPLSSTGTASFNTSTLNTGSNSVTAAYYSDTVFASSSGSATQNVNDIPATISSPSPGSTLSSTPTLTWNPALPVADLSEYALWIGSTPGAYDLFDQYPPPSQTSATAASLPNNGSTVYVRLWSNLRGTWYYNDYSYKTCTAGTGGCTAGDQKATMNSPGPGAVLTSVPTFTWNPATPSSDVSEYALWIGSTPGAYDLFDQYQPPSQTSATAASLPNNGSIVYVRLWSNLLGTWYYNDYTYKTCTAGTGGCRAGDQKATMNSPNSGSVLPSTPTFTWNPATPSSDVSEYALWIGSTPGAYDFFDQYPPPSQTSAVAASLPNNGSTVYVRLWSNLQGTWYYNDYTYTTCTAGRNGCTAGDQKATMQSPDPGSVLTSTPTFTWNPATPASDVGQYALWIGSTPGAYDFFDQYPPPSQTSAIAASLPNNGSTVYVRLWSNLRGTWYYNDYTYTTCTAGTNGCTAGDQKATMQSPDPGSVLSSTPTFSWNPAIPASDVSEYALWIGSAPGTYNLFDQNLPPSQTSIAASGLPNNGSTVYVRLWSYLLGAWYYTDYTYTTCNGCTGN